MVRLSQVQQFMAQQSEADRQIRSVQVEGESIEDALEQASIELGVPLKELEYEVLERGDKGFLGFGKRLWILRAYEKPQEVSVPGLEEAASEEMAAEEKQEELKKDRDGEVFVRLTQEGVFLKVTRPVGKGTRAMESDALDAIRNRHVTDFENSLVAKVVKRADGEYVRVGNFDYTPANDAIMNVEVSSDEMLAYMEVGAPGPRGTDLSFENMMMILQNHGVFHGIKEDVLARFQDYPQYNNSILVAEGTLALNGEDAKIVYNFNAEVKAPVLKEKDGKVDFKELNLVENVVAGQILAKKIPAGEGTTGTTVTGRSLPASQGRDREIEIGKNVKLSEDGLTAISEINGQVFILGKRITVEPIYTVNGDVNLHTGNVLFLGTVIVKGNVEDGFSVKAAGNIEVIGNVGNCLLDAEGDIVIHQGIQGKTKGKVRTSKSVYAKFIEHSRIDAGENVVASEGIIHSFVDANKKIICNGRRASIVGGKLRAAEEINAKNLGSVAGSETICEVGYDPKSKEHMVEIETLINGRMRELEELDLNIKTLTNLKKIQKKLPEDKEKYLGELIEKRKTIQLEIDEAGKELEEIKFRLTSIKLEGKVSASDKVFPGVKIFIKDASLDVRTEFKFVTFVLDQNSIKVTKYEPVEEEELKGRR
jgi:uncharacterized protein (DUF342 family)